MTKVTIGAIDTIPSVDPYQTDLPTYTELTMWPSELRAIVSQEMRSGGTPESEWHNRILTFRIEGHPQEDDIREYLEKDSIQKLLVRICNGHDVEWNGNNMVGTFTKDASVAHENLERMLSENWLGDDSCWAMWDVDEWLSTPRDYVSPEMTDDNIDGEAAILIADAKKEGVIISGDVAELLRATRDEILEEIEVA